MRINEIPLAHFRNLTQYSPMVGDFVVRKGWFNTWTGVVTKFDKGIISIAFEGTPKLLFTMTPKQIIQNTIEYNFSDIVTGHIKAFYFQQIEKSTTIWYV